VASGAFYHDFRDKRVCFEAVYLAVEEDFFDHITRASQAKSDRWERFLIATEAFFDACVAPDVRQIVLIDGPSVLGWDLWHEIEGRYHFSTMRDGLKALMKAGYLERRPPEPLAHLLFGALNEAARLLAHTDDPQRMRRELTAAHVRVLEGLRPIAFARTPNQLTTWTHSDQSVCFSPAHHVEQTLIDLICLAPARWAFADNAWATDQGLSVAEARHAMWHCMHIVGAPARRARCRRPGGQCAPLVSSGLPPCRLRIGGRA